MWGRKASRDLPDLPAPLRSESNSSSDETLPSMLPRACRGPPFLQSHCHAANEGGPSTALGYASLRSGQHEVDVRSRARPRGGEVYRIVVYRARLCGPPRNLPPDEVLGVIALTPEQVVQGPDRRPTLAQLLAEGARIVAGAETVDRETRLYPLGTAQALAQILARSAF